MSRRTWMLIVVLAGGVAQEACAGEWECDGSRRYQLSVDAVESREATADQLAWVHSLTSRLRQAGSVSQVDVLVPSDAKLTINGKPDDCAVFQMTGVRPTRFYLSCLDILVDFSTSTIRSLGTDGLSRHVSPSRSVAAFVHSTGREIGGVPASWCPDVPWALWNPWFEETQVWWY